jgi:hypothetical protein
VLAQQLEKGRAEADHATENVKFPDAVRMGAKPSGVEAASADSANNSTRLRQNSRTLEFGRLVLVHGKPGSAPPQRSSGLSPDDALPSRRSPSIGYKSSRELADALAYLHNHCDSQEAIKAVGLGYTASISTPQWTGTATIESVALDSWSRSKWSAPKPTKLGKND